NRRTCQLLVPAVTPAGYRDARAVEFRLRGDPVEQRVDVLVGVFTLESVVEQGKRFAVSGRPAHVGINQRDSQLAREIIVASQKRGLRLPFGTAVDHDENRALAAELCRRLVQKSRNHFSVEAFPTNQFRRNVLPFYSRFTRGPALELFGCGVQTV